MASELECSLPSTWKVQQRFPQELLERTDGLCARDLYPFLFLFLWFTSVLERAALEAFLTGPPPKSHVHVIFEVLRLALGSEVFFLFLLPVPVPG